MVEGFLTDLRDYSVEELKHLDVKKLWEILKRLKPEQLKVLKAEAADI